MEQAFAMPAEGPDLYRNFVIAIPNNRRRFVRGLEFHPGKAQVIHHAFLRVDPTRESRRQDALDPAPGFPGLHTPATAQTPPGQFLSWQPGKQFQFTPDGLGWALETNCDLVVQAHLRSSGKPEDVRATIGLYFTDTPPRRVPSKLALRRLDIDIPAGAADHVVSETYEVKADVDALGLLAHAHDLGHRLEAFATRPDGGQRCLLRIPDWDFNWQGEYLYQKPLPLPRGSVIHMEWHYDNTTNNPRNPQQPPQRVRYGVQSADEMAELWLQVLPRNPADAEALERYEQPRLFRESVTYNNYLLAQNPNDARAHAELGKALLFLDRRPDAQLHLRRATELDATLDDPHYFLGILHRMSNELPQAIADFRAAIGRNPANAKAHGNLGLLLVEQGQFGLAEIHLQTALRLNPQDTIARDTLADLARVRAGK